MGTLGKCYRGEKHTHQTNDEGVEPCKILVIFTARIRRMVEGTVFSLSVPTSTGGYLIWLMGGGYPIPGPDGWGGGYPIPGPDGAVNPILLIGGNLIPGIHGGTPILLTGSTPWYPPSRTGWGIPPV